MPTHFKLKFDDLTRRVSFAHQPDWQQLSEKISALYSIPQHRVGVTYIDAENEEITLNTEEELQDYYRSSYHPGELIKFSVRDLTSRNRRPPPSADTGIRNTFGQFVDVDIPGIDDWQSVNNIPPLEEILGRTSPRSEARSAFVETVASEEDAVGKEADNTFGLEPGDRGAQSEASEPRIPFEEKGKERHPYVRSMSSTQSLLAADMGEKHPVHVYDVSSHSRTTTGHSFSFDQPGAAIAAESTPRVSTQPLGQDTSTPEKQAERTQEFDDPPLPSFDSSASQPPQSTESAQSAQASASLARDVASFLNMVSGVISSHPELGESLRTIVRNTTNGTYWAVHREALSQAAAEFQRSTENLAQESRRTIEEEAGRRVAEALAGVLRIFAQAQATIQPGANAQSSNATNDSTAQQTDRNDANGQRTEATTQPQTPPMPGAFSSTNFDANFRSSFPFGGRHHWRTRASLPPNFSLAGIPGWAMPHGRSPFGPGVLNATGAAATSQSGPASHFPNTFTPTAATDHAPKPDQTTPGASTSTESNERLSPQELKAKVEEAKKAYKAEKERYRREREERRKEKEKEKTPQRGDAP